MSGPLAFGESAKVWQAACADFVQKAPVGSRFSVTSAWESLARSLACPYALVTYDSMYQVAAYLAERVALGELRFLGNDDHGHGEDWYLRK